MQMLLALTAYPALLLAIPIAGALSMLVIRKSAVRYGVLLLVATAHLTLSAALVAYFALPLTENTPRYAPASLGGLLQPDATGTLFLALASLLFCAASVYAIGYLRTERAHGAVLRDIQSGTAFTNAPEQRFLCCLCLFLAAMSLVTTTQHLGVLWVGIECTTLASAPLIYFHRHKRSLEATWKYLMICSVGIALALLGNILFALALYPESAHTSGTAHVNPLDQVSFFTAIAAKALREGAVPAPWLKVAFIFLLVGYGTKMGLAPLHNWLPDAHSQAPSVVSALLSGALLNCAFLGIVRGHQIMTAAGLAPFSGGLLLFFGLVSLVVAAIFIVHQGQYKRLLAYSSVEHIGILAIGAGLGGAGAFAAMLHSVGHSLTKCMLFLLAGNILHHYRTHSSHDICGMRRLMPITAALWMAGFFALVGVPPFALFVSKVSLLMALVKNEAYIATTVYLTALCVIFIGMSVPVLRMVQGNKPPAVSGRFHETALNIGPPFVLCLAVICLGVWIPDWLTRFLHAAAAVLMDGAAHGL